jgi:hypothetical protein
MMSSSSEDWWPLVLLWVVVASGGARSEVRGVLIFRGDLNLARVRVWEAAAGLITSCVN